jgi:hypothetical protein
MSGIVGLHNVDQMSDGTSAISRSSFASSSFSLFSSSRTARTRRQAVLQGSPDILHHLLHLLVERGKLLLLSPSPFFMIGTLTSPAAALRIASPLTCASCSSAVNIPSVLS